MIKGGVPTNIPIVQRPDGSFASALDPNVAFVPTSTPLPALGPLERGAPGKKGEYHSSHQFGSHAGSTSINHNKPSGHGLGGHGLGSHGHGNSNREPNSSGEFEFHHQHVGPSGTSMVDFNYHGMGSSSSHNGGRTFNLISFIH